MKRKIISILFALVLALSFTLMTAVPAFAAATGNIANNDLGAQVIGMSKTECVQKVTITNPGGAGNLDIDSFAVTNTGTAVNADVTRVAIYVDDNPVNGIWDATDTEIDGAATFTLAAALGADDGNACLSVVKDTTEVVFVVVTTAAGPTNNNTFLTMIDGTDLVGASVDTWAALPAQATATSATTIDAVVPTVAITSAAPDPTNTSPIPVTATFSEDVTGFVEGAIIVGNGTTSNFAGGPAIYTFDVTPAGQGAVTVDIAAAVAQDAAGNDNTVAPQFSITYDSVAPTVAITSAAPDPTNTSPIPVTATFSEDVTGFVEGDIIVGNGATSNFAGGPAVYTFDVTPAGQGAVTVDIAAAVAQDAAGNDNTVAPQFSITYDNVAPTVAITSTASPGPTTTSPIPVTATFSENVLALLEGDITVGNGATSNFVAVSATIYTFDVTPAAQGAVTVDIAAAVTLDAAGNVNTVAPQFSITYTVIVYGGGWVPPAPTPTIETNLFGSVLSFSISDTGEILETVTGTSADGNLTLTIPAGTIALDEDGNPLSTLTSDVDVSPPPPPSHIIGLAYNFGPNGATFNPAITLTWSYDPDALPEGVAEEDLVIAYYDEEAGEWVECDFTCAPETDCITGYACHFTTFAIIAHTPAPAAFSASNLSIQPAEVQPKEAVTISVSVTNTGDLAGSYEVTLKIDNVVEASKEITVNAGASEKVTFTTAKDVAGSYSVAVNGLSGSFTVKEPAPTPAPPPAPPPPAPEAINWWLIGGIIAVVVVGLLILFLVRRRA